MKYEGKPWGSWDTFQYVHVKCRVYWYKCMRKNYSTLSLFSYNTKMFESRGFFKGWYKGDKILITL